MTKPTSCPGCDVAQFGKRVPSMWHSSKFKIYYICQACEQFENTQIFQQGKPLRGIGKNGNRPS